MFKVLPPPNNVDLTTKAPIKDVKVNIVRGGGGGEDYIVKRIRDLRVLLLKCLKTFGHDCSLQHNILLDVQTFLLQKNVTKFARIDQALITILD